MLIGAALCLTPSSAHRGVKLLAQPRRATTTHHRRSAQNKGRPPETSGPSAAMLRPVSMTSVRAAEGESNSACENTNSVRTRHTRNAPAAVPDAVEHSGLGRALTRAEGLRLRPVVSLSPRDNVRGPLAPPPRTRHDASGQVRAGPGTPGASRKSCTYQLQLLHARGFFTLVTCVDG